ncbi:MAG: hypothetical protein EAZ50_07425 [Runella slithyformis]|nr:MAG: hypothetical protein EAZ50_07425 [Runella slithyformis]
MEENIYPRHIKNYLFIDECGSPDFFGHRKKLLVGTDGFQPLLIIGAVITENRKALRKSIVEFGTEIKKDPDCKDIYSLQKPDWFFHARADHPIVKDKFFEFLSSLSGFKAFVVIGRKEISRFTSKHNGNANEFYFDMLYHLLKDRLSREDTYYQVFLSQRQKSNTKDFTESVKRAIDRDNKRRKNTQNIKYQCDMVMSSAYPEMSVIDYLLWALQRYILRGEHQYYDLVKDKFSLIIDLYDVRNYKKGANYYNKKSPFDLSKATPFQ